MNETDNARLGALVGKMLGDLAGAFSVPTVRIGFRTGLFEAFIVTVRRAFPSSRP